MGQRPVKTEEVPEQKKHEQAPVQVDAAKMIARLQAQRAALQEQLDFAELAMEDKNEQIQNLLTRVAELEEKEK